MLGATGHLGNAVVRELLARGHAVTALSRGTREPANLRELDVRRVQADVEEEGRLSSMVEGHDLVVDAAAPYPIDLAGGGRRGGIPTLVARAERRTAALVATVSRHRARLAYLGSFVTTPRGRGGLTGLPTRWVRRLHPYFAVKERIEERLLAACGQGLRAVVIQPTTCLGPWDCKPRRLCVVPRLVRGEIPVLLRKELNVIDVREVASGLVAAVEAELWGRTVRLAGCNLSFASLAAWVCEEGGGRPPRMEIPPSLGVVASSWLEASLSLFGRETPFPALALLLVAESAPQAPSAEQDELGIVPRDLSATIRDAVRWYQRLGYC